MKKLLSPLLFFTSLTSFAVTPMPNALECDYNQESSCTFAVHFIPFFNEAFRLKNLAPDTTYQCTVNSHGNDLEVQKMAVESGNLTYQPSSEFLFTQPLKITNIGKTPGTFYFDVKIIPIDHFDAYFTCKPLTSKN